MPESVRISAVLCTYNEDYYLDECLGSLSWADEIVLCDMGSEDRTLEIAKSHNCLIRKIRHVDFVELARQEAVGYCSNEWVCVADPDFIFPAEAVPQIRGIIDADPEVTCFTLLYINYYKGRPVWHGRWGAYGRYPAVFRKDAMNLPAVLHNGFALKFGKSVALDRKLYIRHMWIKDEEHFYRKHIRYIEREGTRRMYMGLRPSAVRTMRLLFSRIFLYLFRGGILDGSTGIDLFRKSVWYEKEAEKRLAESLGAVEICSICGAAGSRIKYSLYDDRYGYPERFLLFECGLCGHKFLKADFPPQQISDIYTKYYPRADRTADDYKPHRESGGFMSWLDGIRCRAFRRVPENIRVLDIGCGFGETLGYHNARGCDVYGVEVDENIRKVSDKFGFKVHVGFFDPSLYEENFFDYVTMDQVIEHLTAPVDVLKGVHRVLKQGGRLILSTPNPEGFWAKVFGRRWINWHAPYHLQHFSKKSVSIAADKAGFIIEKSETVTSSDWLYYQWLHIVSYPSMGVRSAFWSSRPVASFSGRALTAIMGIVHKLRINHVITRLIDATGMGDNRLYVLRKK